MSGENDSLLPLSRSHGDDGTSPSVDPGRSNVGFFKAYSKKIAIAALLALVCVAIGLHAIPNRDKQTLQENSTTDLAVFTGSLYSANSGNNQNSAQIIYLDRHNVDCGNNYITRFRVSGAIRIDYHCMAMDNYENGHHVVTTRQTSYAWGGEHGCNHLDRQSVYCPSDELMTQYKMITAWGYRFAYEYKCGKRNWQSLSCSAHSTNWDKYDNLQWLDRHDVSCDSSSRILQGFDVDSTRAWEVTSHYWGCRGWGWFLRCTGGWGWIERYGWVDKVKYNYRCCSINAPDPTPYPVANPTPVPVANPTNVPVATPTNVPVASPTLAPVADPTMEPTTLAPVAEPTDEPTLIPIAHPTLAPVADPTDAPTEAPVVIESNEPTKAPVATPTDSPTLAPVTDPTEAPIADPTDEPTLAPVATPTKKPVADPTLAPIAAPTEVPVADPTLAPVAVPSAAPSLEPVAVPTLAPVVEPTMAPVADLTEMPTINARPIACKVEFDQKADFYTKDLDDGCAIVAENDIGYPDFKGTSQGIIVCGSTKIGDLFADNIGLKQGISYLYAAPKMELNVYENKNLEGNPVLSWKNTDTSFIHNPANDKVGGIDFVSSVELDPIPSSCKIGTKLALPVSAPTPAPKIEGGNVTEPEEEAAFDAKPLPSEDEVTDEGENAEEKEGSNDDETPSISESQGAAEGEKVSEEEIAKEIEAAKNIPAPTIKPEVENTDDDDADADDESSDSKSADADKSDDAADAKPAEPADAAEPAEAAEPAVAEPADAAEPAEAAAPVKEEAEEPVG